MAKSRRQDSFGYGYMASSRTAHLPCFECGVLTNGRHHVVPVSLGGTKQLPLCYDCHDKVHGSGIKLSPLIKLGMEKARKAGKHIGAPVKVSDKLKQSARDLKSFGLTYKEVAMILGISVGSVFSAIRAIEP